MLTAIGGIFLTTVAQTVMVLNFIFGIRTESHEANQITDRKVETLTLRVDANDKSTAAQFQANKDQRDMLIRNRDLQYEGIKTTIDAITKRQDSTDATVQDFGRKIERLLTLTESINDRLNEDRPKKNGQAG